MKGLQALYPGSTGSESLMFVADADSNGVEESEKASHFKVWDVVNLHGNKYCQDS